MDKVDPLGEQSAQWREGPRRDSHGPGEDHELTVDERHRGRDHRRERTQCVIPDARRRGVSRRRPGDDLLGEDRLLGGHGVTAGDGGLGSEGLDATAATASADHPRGVERDVPDLSRGPVGPPQDAAATDDGAAHAQPHHHEQHVRHIAADSRRVLGEGAGGGVVDEEDG